MLMPDWYHLNLFVHLVAVSLWLGLTVNFSMMTVPLLRELPEEQAEHHLTEICHRARRMVVVLMGLLLLTGTLNLYRVGLLTRPQFWGKPYGITVGLKVSLALLLFVGFPFLFVAVHRWGSDELDARINRMNWLHWGISGITVVIMFLGVIVRG